MTVKANIKTSLEGQAIHPDMEPLGFLIYERSKFKEDQAPFFFRLDKLTGDLPDDTDIVDYVADRAQMILLGNGIDHTQTDVTVAYHESVEDFRETQVEPQYVFVGKGEPADLDAHIEQVYKPKDYVERDRPLVDPDARRQVGEL